MIRKIKFKGICMLMFILCLSIILTGIPIVSMAEEMDDEIIAIYLIKDGIKREISFEEYEELLKQNDIKLSNHKKETMENISYDNNKDLIRPQYLEYTYYVEWGYEEEVIRESLTERVSSYRQNLTDDPIQRTMSISTTVEFDSSFTLNYEYKDALQVELGLSWTRSKAFKDEDTMTIRPGYYGWFEFTPIMENSWGYFVTYDTAGNVIEKRFVDSYSPRSMQGFSDGILIAKTARTIN